ncbi:MAG: ABC transporter substrate-binding protein [Labilithrix sp.]|nr:ABC transporter substrate-binding protein [Labilithrix sp.]
MRSIRASISGSALALALAACDSGVPAPIPRAHPESNEPRRGGTVTSASFGDIRFIDPANVADGLVPMILQQIFAGLVDFDLDGKIKPDLAERWTTEGDGRIHRFVLRRGVRFHDGEEVTADDVKRSVERALHPTAPNPYASYFAGIKGFADFTAKKKEHLEGVTVEGSHEITFTLDDPDSTFLPLLAMHMLRPVCRSAGSRYADGWHPCGAGPFKLPPGGWDHGREVRLVRHDGYWRAGLPYLDGARFLFHVTVNSQKLKFARGEQDVLRDFLAPDLLKLQADPRWKPHAEYEIEKQIGGIAMNVEMAPFDDVEIRRAVAAAIDREQLRLIRAGNLRAGTKPVPPGVEGYDATLDCQRYDLDAALEHMRRAGYPYDPITKTGGYPHVVPYLTYAESLDEAMAQVFQQQLAKIGIRLELRLTSYATLLALRGRRKQAAIGPGFWQQDYPEASTFLEPLFHGRSINDADANNWSFYENARFDELVDRARKDPDVEVRRTYYREAQRIVCDEAPWAFTHFYRHYTQWQPYVRDFRPHPMWTMDLARTWVDR